MKEHIYTIPVIDGFKEKNECPFCNMYDKLESDAINYMLGPSYMEDDIRMDTNKYGFCIEHYKQMYAQSNRLGLSLMIHTHLQKINSDIDKHIEEISKPNTRKSGFFKKETTDASDNLVEYLLAIEKSCYICDKIDNSFEQFIDTFFYLWKVENHIVSLVKESNGFCLRHFRILLERGKKKLNPKDYSNFCDIILPKQLQNLKRIEDDIDWFIRKFDYRNNDEPWKNSKDALPRALQKVSSIKVSD